MNVTFEKTSDTMARLTVSVEESDYSQKVTDELKKFGRTHNIPGFRPGHVSIDQLRRRFGRQMMSDVINQEAAEAALNYIRDNKIDILGEPIPVEVKEITPEQKDYTFAYDLGLSPELTVTLDKSVTLPYYTIKVSDEMMEQQDRELRERFGAQVPSDKYEDKALVKGALMELNADGTIKEGADAIQVVDGILAPMFFKSKEEAAKFEGTKVGDKVRFNPWNTCDGNVAELSSMLHVDKAVAGDIKADFEMAISEFIVVRLAELDEEYYKEVFGPDKVHDEKEYREALKQLIAQSLLPNSEQMLHNDIHKYLMDKYAGSMQLPEEFLKRWLLRRNPELAEADLDADFEKMIPGIKWEIITDTIAKQADMKVEEADLLALARQIARQQFAQYGMLNLDDETVDRFAKNILADKNSRPRIIEQVTDRKLFNIIKASITLDNKEVSLDEFKKLANPDAE